MRAIHLVLAKSLRDRTFWLLVDATTQLSGTQTHKIKTRPKKKHQHKIFYLQKEHKWYEHNSLENAT